MAKEEKTLSEEDRKRIEQEAEKDYGTYKEPGINTMYDVFIEGAEYEHKYQREQQAELRNENEYLKQLLKLAADMLPAYVGPPETPEINKPSEELYHLIQDAINSLKK